VEPSNSVKFGASSVRLERATTVYCRYVEAVYSGCNTHTHTFFVLELKFFLQISKDDKALLKLLLLLTFNFPAQVIQMFAVRGRKLIDFEDDNDVFRVILVLTRK
jgi:hypothetical protein